MKVAILAPCVDKDGKPLSPGQEVDLDDETARALQMAGKAGDVYDPKAQATGNFSARTERAGATPPPAAKPVEPANAPEPESKKK